MQPRSIASRSTRIISLRASPLAARLGEHVAAGAEITAIAIVIVSARARDRRAVDARDVEHDPRASRGSRHEVRRLEPVGAVVELLEGLDRGLLHEVEVGGPGQVELLELHAHHRGICVYQVACVGEQSRASLVGGGDPRSRPGSRPPRTCRASSGSARSRSAAES